MKEIPLTQEYMTIVDDEDYEWLSQWKWHVVIRPRNAYAIRGHGTTIYMHRAIVGTAAGMQTDHINGDGLDNRRVNLRECTRHQHNGNSRSFLGSSSRFKGVSWDKRHQKWEAGIVVNGCKRRLGFFSVETEAAEAYKAAAAIAFGAFAAGARGDRVAAGLPL